MSTRDCKKCTRPLLFAESRETGRPVPLDVTTNGKCYQLLPDGRCTIVEGVMVTHFATCPEASSFSKSATPATPGPQDEGEQARLRQLVYDIDEHGEDLTKWEIDFIARLVDVIDRPRFKGFSAKEAARIEQIGKERLP